MHELLPNADGFAVTILSADQEGESSYFATRDRAWGREQFDGWEWRPATVTGSPILTRGVAFLECLVTECHAGGDRSIVLGHVVDLGPLRADASPLLFYAGRYRRLVTVED